MTQTITIDPVSRVEGHMRIDIGVSDGVISWAKSSGTSFRGFEPIMSGRDPREAAQLTQRICGVCPIPQGRCASEAVESAGKLTIPRQALTLRNLLLMANYVDSHLAHFYLMSVPDYVAGTLAAGAWPAGVSAKAWSGGKVDAPAIAKHVALSLAIRRKCQEIIALLGGRAPHPTAVVPGGVTVAPTDSDISAIGGLIRDILAFVDDEYASDVEALATAFPAYTSLGATGATMLSYGGFPRPDGTYVFDSGVVAAGGSTVSAFDATAIQESVYSSFYQVGSDLHPSLGETVPVVDRSDGYSWIKAPRLGGKPCEVGPLARAVVQGRDSGGYGVWPRHRARRNEASTVLQNGLAWVALLEAGQLALSSFPDAPTSGSGAGLVEAPRGALGHWVTIENQKITRYNVVSPTTWNGSPRDASGVAGPIESALVGVPVADPSEPIEAVRVVHSFDPCLQCAVH